MNQSSIGHVFISYSRLDDDVMRRVVDYLRSQEIKVWVDNEKLTPGTSVWEEEIEKAIINASAVVVLQSPDSKLSKWVRREITYADEYNKRIFPILVRGENSLSSTIRLITNQYIDIRHNETEGLELLKNTLTTYFVEYKNQLSSEKIKAEAEQRAKAKAEQRAKAEAEQKAKAEAEQRAKAEADRLTANKTRVKSVEIKPISTSTNRRKQFSMGLTLGALVVGVLLLICGIGYIIMYVLNLPAATPPLTQRSVLPTHTQESVLPNNMENGFILADDFSSQKWGTGTDANSAVEYVGNALNIIVYKGNYFVWSTPDDKAYSDVHMEVTVINNGTDSTTAFGFICNKSTGNDFYYFAITAAGQYAIAKAVEGEKDLFLTNNDEWADSDLISVNASSYRLGADCGNGLLALYVDGQLIDSVIDSTYTSGQVAVIAWSGEKVGITTDVSFDDFLMTDLP